ncbi:MAG: type II toxin-antitoxin system PemK/MazF family toxin [Desulfosarcina sp.]
MVVKRFDVVLMNLDPTVGSEIQKTRPCLILSPDYRITAVVCFLR